jgi:hypothetical protein
MTEIDKPGKQDADMRDCAQWLAALKYLVRKRVRHSVFKRSGYRFA